MASTYYDSSGKEVVDGDIAYASDLNDVNSAIDTGFQLVETDIDALQSNQSYYTDLAESWATAAEDVQVEPGKYSAYHWAQKADDDATATAADRVQTGLDRTAASDSASAASGSAISASGSALSASGFATNASNSALDAQGFAGDASGFADDAAQSAIDAAFAVTQFPTLSAADQGKYLKVSTPYTDGYETAVLDLSGYAPLSSPTFTGTPAAPTASVGTDTTQIATTAFVQANGKPKAIQVFTSSGTYTPTTGAKYIIVELCGGGGSGGGSGSGLNSSGSGAAGGYSKKLISLSGIVTVSVTIGTGGTAVSGANNGNAGGTTSFGAHCSATGGSGGLTSANNGGTLGVAGGEGSGGQINIKGGCGGPGSGISTTIGGSSFFGGGNRRGATDGAYGAGGQGAIEASTTSAAGVGGIVIITEY